MTIHPPPKPFTSIEGCVVVDSSGCHRYDYWNEQAVFEKDLNSGWCSPSRSLPTEEFLEIDLMGHYPVTGVRMLSRSINENAGFPGRVEVQVLQNGTWITSHIEKDITCPCSTWLDITFPPVIGSRIRLLMSQVSRRPEAKYFTQFMALEILKAEDAHHAGSSPRCSG